MFLKSGQEVGLSALTNPDDWSVVGTVDFKVERVFSEDGLELWLLLEVLGGVDGSEGARVSKEEDIEVAATKGLLQLCQLYSNLFEIIASEQNTLYIKGLWVKDDDWAFLAGVQSYLGLHAFVSKWIDWLHIWWFHHNALYNSCFSSFSNYHCMILIKIIYKLSMKLLWHNRLDPLHILLSAEESIIIIVLIELHAVVLCLIIWEVVIVPVANGLAIRIS